MKEKILNVKNILKIILILFILFNMAKSCSYANSWNYTNLENYSYNGNQLDFFKQCFEETTGWNFDDDEYSPRNANETTYLSNCLNNLANERNQIIKYMIQTSSSGTHNPKGKFLYVRFIKPIGQNGSYAQYGFEYYDGQLRVTQSLEASTSETLSGTMISSGLALWYCDKNNSNISNNYIWYKSKNNTIVIENKLEFRPLYDYIKTISNKQFYVSEWTLGFSYIELGELINWENRPNLKGEMYKWTSSSSFEYIGDIRILVDGRTQIQTNNIYYNQGYLIRFTYGDGESTGYYNFYFVPYGGNSGDFSGELIYQPSDPNEYKPITNTINENNDMWKDIYNSLFVMDSGDVQQLKNRISGELIEVIDGKNDYTEEYELLDTLNNTRPTDFIISWNAVQYENQNFIPSGEINFNNIVTEWGLTEVHRVLRIIVVGALAFVGARALWKCITITLGIGMEMYDENKEEENIVTEIDEDTGRTTQYTNTTRGNRTRVNIKDKTIEKPRRRIGF